MAKSEGLSLLHRAVLRAESGLKPIEEVEQGELVWAADPITREWSLQEVVEPLVHDYVGDLRSGGPKKDFRLVRKASRRCGNRDPSATFAKPHFDRDDES